MTEYTPVKTREYPSDIPQISNVAKNIWRITNTIASIWLQKYAWISVLGHYLFLRAPSVLKLRSQNCLLPRTDNVHGQIFEHILATKGGYCFYTIATIDPTYAHIKPVKILKSWFKSVKIPISRAESWNN